MRLRLPGTVRLQGQERTVGVSAQSLNSQEHCGHIKLRLDDGQHETRAVWHP